MIKLQHKSMKFTLDDTMYIAYRENISDDTLSIAKDYLKKYIYKRLGQYNQNHLMAKHKMTTY